MHWSDPIGWCGFFVVLFSYAMVALQRWRVRSIQNQLGNILGSGALVINSFFYQAWVPVVLNVLWVSFALWTLLHMVRHDRQRA